MPDSSTTRLNSKPATINRRVQGTNHAGPLDWRAALVPPSRVTIVASCRLVNVVSNATVIRICLTLIVLVAVEARKGGEIVWNVVAGLTGIPLAAVRARVDREVRSIMVKRRTIPGIDTVTIQAGRREAGSLMFVVVVLLVTRDTIVVVGGLEDQAEVRHRVAVFARERRVGAEKFEAAGCGRVVKRGVAPAIDTMAV